MDRSVKNNAIVTIPMAVVGTGLLALGFGWNWAQWLGLTLTVLALLPPVQVMQRYLSGWD